MQVEAHTVQLTQTIRRIKMRNVACAKNKMHRTVPHMHAFDDVMIFVTKLNGNVLFPVQCQITNEIQLKRQNNYIT